MTEIVKPHSANLPYLSEREKMINNKRTLLFAVLIAALSLTACSPPTAAPETKGDEGPTSIQLGLGFIPSVQFAPFYVAVEKGYFADEDLAVELQHGFETDFLKLLGTDERQFIVASGEQVILGRAQGLPVNYVAAWYIKFPVVIFAKAESGITQPQDLVGKRVGIPGLYGASYIAWKGLLHATGLPEDEITLESIGFTQAAAISEGIVDAANDYAVNGPVQLRLAGDEVNTIVIDDYIQMPANGLLTNEKTLTEQPELVEAMVRAMLRGIRYTLDNPDDAFEVSLKYVPEAAQERETNRAIYDASFEFWTPPSNNALGLTDPEIWPSTAVFMLEAGLIDHPVETEGIWTNDFVEAVTGQ
ncbi:MAG: ABC transporter substrate-binding protein [Proteobacteria bacterium]|nr:ABC transporter substrate-binding protein [Pseudomonadota bacterium]